MRNKSSKKHGVNSLLNKSQSAMEYLMTYGWAILIIAIVLVALFSLGIFNSANFAPRAQPGACEVLRNSVQTSLVGQCNGMLPEYVVQVTPPPNHGIYAAPVKLGFNYTITAWFNVLSFSGGSCSNCAVPIDVYNATVNGGIGGNQGYDYGGAWIYPTYGSFCLGWPNSWQTCAYSYQKINTGQWYFFAGSVTDYNSIIAYVNGLPSNSTSFSPIMSEVRNNNLMLGVGDNPPGGDEVSDAYISNVQLYNTTLTQSEIQALYKEGIGGAPINVNNIVGWWPLNGDANDYGGNGNDGTALNVTYTSAWTSGYSAP